MTALYPSQEGPRKLPRSFRNPMFRAHEDPRKTAQFILVKLPVFSINDIKFYGLSEKTELINWIFGLPDMKFYKNEWMVPNPRKLKLSDVLMSDKPKPMKILEPNRNAVHTYPLWTWADSGTVPRITRSGCKPRTVPRSMSSPNFIRYSLFENERFWFICSVFKEWPKIDPLRLWNKKQWMSLNDELTFYRHDPNPSELSEAHDQPSEGLILGLCPCVLVFYKTPIRD